MITHLRSVAWFMIDRFWIVARLVCIVRGHSDEIISTSTSRPMTQCRCCDRTVTKNFVKSII